MSESTSTSWMGRLGESLKQVLLGLALFAAAFPVLWINEGCSARTLALIAEGKQAVIPVVATDAPNPEFDGRLVHISGGTRTDETLSDDDFGVQAHALRLRRTVDIYQWTEKKQTEKGDADEEDDVEYVYERKWVDAPVDSSKFDDKSSRHRNHGSMPYDHEKIWNVSEATIGTRRLTESQIRQFDDWESLPVTDDVLKRLSEEVTAERPPAENDADEPAEAASDAAANSVDDSRRTWNVQGGTLYRSSDPSEPQIGDLRVEFATAPLSDASLLAAQSGSTFRTWQPPSGRGEIDRVEVGIHTSGQMFDHMTSENSRRTWFVRGGGWLIMAFGITLLFRPLTGMTDSIPLLGTMLQYGVWLFAGVIAGACAILTIAIAWLAYRPVIAVCLIALAVGIVVGLIWLGRRRRRKYIENAVA